jgi:hypothetical protein
LQFPSEKAKKIESLKFSNFLLHKIRNTALWMACKLLITKKIKSRDFY